MKPIKPTHGGPRTPGPGKRNGRPPVNGVATVCRSYSVTPDVRDYLLSHTSASAEIERLVRGARGFKAWLATRSGKDGAS